MRLVTYVTAEVDVDMAADPLLPTVGWTWLVDALDAQDAHYRRHRRHGHPDHVDPLRRPRPARPTRGRHRDPGELDPDRRRPRRPPAGLVGPAGLDRRPPAARRHSAARRAAPPDSARHMVGSHAAHRGVGGGIAGLAAAVRFNDAAPGTQVTVVRAGRRRVGGKLRTGELAGSPVETGAEAFLVRDPAGGRAPAVTLARRVGLGDDAGPPDRGAAALAVDGELRRSRRGTLIGVPVISARWPGWPAGRGRRPRRRPAAARARRGRRRGRAGPAPARRRGRGPAGRPDARRRVRRPRRPTSRSPRRCRRWPRSRPGASTR